MIALASITLAQAAPTIRISVDATDAPRKIFHAKLEIPATPGTLTLYYPKWIPGEHGPTGPIQDLTGLKFTANGETLTWRRDLLDGWTFYIQVPDGASMVEASLDFLSPAGSEGIYTGGASATDKLTVLSWNTVLLYPAGFTSDQLTYQADLRLPEGWKFGTALPVGSQSGADISFQPASLTRLVDSPVISGEYLLVVPLAENPHQEMDIAADSPDDLITPQNFFSLYKNLTEQAQKLFRRSTFATTTSFTPSAITSPTSASSTTNRMTAVKANAISWMLNCAPSPPVFCLTNMFTPGTANIAALPISPLPTMSSP